MTYAGYIVDRDVPLGDSAETSMTQTASSGQGMPVWRAIKGDPGQLRRYRPGTIAFGTSEHGGMQLSWSVAMLAGLDCVNKCEASTSSQEHETS